MTAPSDAGRLAPADIERCFGGAIPAVLATASSDGIANVTYISRAHRVDHERIALSNQFLSKTAKNLAANPHASLLLMDPVSHAEYCLTLVYERTERRGHVFERLRQDIDALAALHGLQEMFRLRAADIFRVVEIELVPPHEAAVAAYTPAEPMPRDPAADLAAAAGVARRLGRVADLESAVDTVMDALVADLGYAHVNLMLLDEDGRRLYTIASRGFPAEGVGAEIAVGDGLIGVAAARCEPMRIGNLLQMAKYSRTLRAQWGRAGDSAQPRDVPMPGLPRAESRVVVPAMAVGELVGVIVVDSADPVAFTVDDEHVLGTVAGLFAGAVTAVRALADDDEPINNAMGDPVVAAEGAVVTMLRFFAADGSVFLDDEYLIKGVAGRILWTLARQYVESGRTAFSNKELRLDPTLDLPGFKDNLENRLLLLKRRLDERHATLRIERTGRGRFSLQVDTTLELTAAE